MKNNKPTKTIMETLLNRLSKKKEIVYEISKAGNYIQVLSRSIHNPMMVEIDIYNKNGIQCGGGSENMFTPNYPNLIKNKERNYLHI